VLERKLGFVLADKDIYVSVAGGGALAEPAGDLAVATALVSSLRDLPLPPGTLVLGEVGLAGEVRAVGQSTSGSRKRPARLLALRAPEGNRARVASAPWNSAELPMWDRPWTRCSHSMTPVGDDQEERRRHQRAPVDLQVSLKFPSVQQFLSAYAGDVSESGMFIRTEGPAHQPGQLVTLRFEAGEERIVQGKARVVRVEAAGMGVEFVELDESSRRLIEMIVRIKLAAG